MPEFAYTARDAQGLKTSGSLSAATEREALGQLAGKSLFPISVTVEKKASDAMFGGRVSGQLLAVTLGQLAALLRCGVPMLRSLVVLRSQTSNATLKEVLQDVHDKVEDGSTLAEAMGRHERVFGEITIHMVRAGGEGGFLEDALVRVSKFTEDQEDLKSRTIGALAYPVFLAVVGTLIIAGILVFLVPMFGEMFEQLREEGRLPAITEWLLAFSEGLQSFWWVILLAIGLVVAIVRAQLATERGRRVRDLIKLKLPLVGRVFKSLAVARFCRVLGTLLHNGVPILRSLEISRDASGNRILSEAIAQASENITAGESLAKPLRRSGHFPVPVVEMISVAEESNSLETVLTDIADGLELRTQRQLDLAVRLIEPAMLLVMAVIVLIVVIALLLPIFRMSEIIA